ncbi:MAG TPA: metal-dependent transcriptional regulator [Methanoculleus sp.]|nr:metal-dependent transcriptional regulator [Methanoculleus sp.]
MHISDHEDYLEALLNHNISTLDEKSMRMLAASLGRSQEQVLADLRHMEEEGEIVLEDKGTLRLTDEGRRRGECVQKKHRVLESFLTEMLGMDPETASKEACAIEHNASNETIQRLQSHLHSHSIPQGCTHFRQRHGCRHDIDLPTLKEFHEGDHLRILMVGGPRRTSRLNDMGIIPGEEVVIRRRLANGALVIEIKESDIAISPEIASTVYAEKIE